MSEGAPILDPYEVPVTQPARLAEVIGLPTPERVEEELGAADAPVDLTSPAGAYDPREQRRLYPYIQFGFRREWFEGSGVITPTTGSRTRTALLALKDADIGYEDLDFEEAAQKYAKFTSYLKTKIAVDDRFEARGVHIPLQGIIEQMMDEYARVNHPVYQMFEQLNEYFPDTPAHVYRELHARVIVATADEELYRHYQDTLKTKKRLTLPA